MKKIKLVCLLLILIVLFAFFLSGFDRAAEQYADFEVKNYISELINTTFYEYTLNHLEIAEKIIEINTKNGKIVSVNIKSPALNIYTAQLMNNITQKLKSCDTSEIGIPFGNITNTKLLSGIGPKIKIKIVPLGNISSDTKTSFDSAGINQTLLKINLKICCAFSVSTPFKQMTREMMFDYTICEMLIVGEIPQFYLHKLTDAPFQKQ